MKIVWMEMRVKLKVAGISCAMCAKEIEDVLKRFEGIKKISVDPISGFLFIDFDEDKISVTRLIAAVEDLGYRVVKEIGELSIRIEGMSCSMCVRAVENTLKSFSGVIDQKVTIGKSIVSYDPNVVSAQEIVDAIRNSGYEAFVEDERKLEIEGEIRRNRFRKLKKHLAVSWLSGILLIFIMIFFKGILYLEFAIATLAILYAGKDIFSKAYISMKNKTLTMELMYAMGISSAYFASVLATVRVVPDDFNLYETSVLLMAFLLLGKFLEERAMRKTSEAVKRLMELQPKKATVFRNGVEIEVSVSEIKVGDIVVVKPGERIPADGVVVEGESYVDESMISGEIIPKLKKIGDTVIGATINKNSILKIRAEKVGRDAMLAQIIRVVENAQLSKPPIQRIADKVVSLFIPLVLFIAISSFIYWYFIASQSFVFAFTSLLSVLVISCPCAFGLATPTALAVGIGKGAEMGVLIKRSEVLEVLKKATLILFDKTGTITKGLPEVTEIFGFGMEEKDILKIAASVEKNSEHPIGEAIIKKAIEMKISLESVQKFEEIAGKGVKAYVNSNVILGNKTLMLSEGVEIADDVFRVIEKLENDGKTTVVLSMDGKAVGVIGISDKVRDDAFEVVRELKKRMKVGIVTGDSWRVAKAVGKELGVEFIHAEISPAEKAEIVEKMQKKGEIVVFVGDGINDAAALAQADIGIAVSGASDITVESGDIVLLRNELGSVLRAIKLSQNMISKIKQNIFWAMIYNSILIPLAAGLSYPLFGISLRPEFAAGAMSLSSLSVVSNSLLLKKAKI
ncbi:MAG: heavy metal translocating P-type ATPase [Archaeoglobaceae archaeon]